ncbi:hypothetical protein PAEPH01_1575 [Pancytospora epiphaga]|nr:hypothetical protein PAEPH01_1575 [Pancytospora epiphaga]
MTEDIEERAVSVESMMDGIIRIERASDIVMDELLRNGQWVPFSRKYGVVTYMESIKGGSDGNKGKYGAERGGVPEERIDFGDESFASLRRIPEESNKWNYDCEDEFKENRYMLGKNFQCPMRACTKVYTSSYGLRYHMDHGHTAEKISERRPYVCDIGGCGKSYKNSNGLKYHITHAHKEVTLNGPDCIV